MLTTVSQMVDGSGQGCRCKAKAPVIPGLCCWAGWDYFLAGLPALYVDLISAPMP